MCLRCGVVGLVAMMLAATAAAQSGAAAGPERVVEKLYAQVEVRRPVGLPDDEDLKAFAPYLSHGLMEKFRTAGACWNDWYAKTPGVDGKPEVAWGNLSPFAGVLEGEKRGMLIGFKVEKSEAEKDGSVRVFLQVLQKADGGTRIKPVAVILTRESGPYVVGDVIYEMEHHRDVNGQSQAYATEMSRLSQYLSVGCGESAKAVQGLFNLAMSRRPHDISVGQDWTAFAPYLSRALMQKIEASDACSVEWDKQNPYPRAKVLRPSADDLVTTGDGLSDPKSFQLQLVEAKDDGSFWMYVLPEGGSDYDPERLAAVVIHEGGHFVVDDVVYLHYVDFRDFPDQEPNYRRMSDYLAAGCDGSHWLRNSLPDKPTAFVQSFYKEIVTRQFADVPYGENWKTLAPYFSRGLLHDFRVYDVCEAEVMKENEAEEKKEGIPLKVTSLAESRLFGGEGDTVPTAFFVEKTEPQTDRSVRVTVKITVKDDMDSKQTSTEHVMAVVTREDEHYVLEDVLHLDDENGGADDSKTSEMLTAFDHCDGGLGPR